MKNVQKPSNASSADLVGTLIAAAAAFVIGLLVYDPLAGFEFDFIFFEDFSVNKTAGSWSHVVKYFTVTVFGILSGLAYYFLSRDRKMAIVAGLPLALFLGILGMTVLVIISGMVFGMLAVIALIAAMLFGPGDR